MAKHPAIVTVVERIRKDEIGGAADTAKEVVRALGALVAESGARDVEALSSEVDQAVLDILRVLPSLAPAINALHRFVGQMEETQAQAADLGGMKAALLRTCDDFLSWADNALSRLAQYGSEKISDGDRVFMFSMSSSVWAILRAAKERGKEFEVVVTEARPGNEGLWSVKEMDRAGIPVSVGIDASIGELIPLCDVAFAGADVVSSTGHVLNKAGTYPSALVAKAHGVPFYIAADTLKFDTGTLLGLPYRNEPIRREDVLDESYPSRVRVLGYLFDETPPDLITGIITEIGILHPAVAYSVMQRMKLSRRVSELLPSWSRGEL